MLRLLTILWMCILTGCESSEAEPSSFLRLNFGDTLLKVPSKYVLPNLPTSITGDGGNLDDGESISLKIPLPDIGYVVSSDKGLIGNSIVFLTPASQHPKEVGKDIFDAWRGEGLYSNRIVEYDEAVNLYRVYPKAGHPKLWNYFRDKPNGGNLAPSSWVANCTVGPLSQEAADLSNVTCKTVTSYKDVQVELSYSGVHLSSLESLINKLNVQLSSWELKN